MKILKQGTFLKERTHVDWDEWGNMPIGMHFAYRRDMRENAQSAAKRYYWQDKDGKIFIVRSPRFHEKVLAMFNKCRAKVAGYVSESEVVETTKDIPELGM